MREAPSETVANYLHERGAIVRAYDPAAMDNAIQLMPFLNLAEDPYDLARGCDAMIVMTPWNEFKQLDLERVHGLMKEPIIIDGRDLYDPEDMKTFGFTYRGVGRGYANGKPD
jgi:UDPglucose 6-dehydrogenase